MFNSEQKADVLFQQLWWFKSVVDAYAKSLEMHRLQNSWPIPISGF
jgi:hypothetical protein